ncbi:MAG: hypothetical protein N2255_01485, partial [Kiritimatiellae bacterium]|nr:hypothetical protein [Kiritimatiellia bacterium]
MKFGKRWPKIGLLTGLVASVLRGAEIPKGLGVDETMEAELRRQTEKLLEMVRAEKPDYAAILSNVQKARKLVLRLPGKKEGPEMSLEPDIPEVGPEAVVACYETIAAEDVLRLWREQ